MYIKFGKSTGHLTFVDERKSPEIIDPEADEYGVAEVDIGKNHGNKVVDIASLQFSGEDVVPESVRLISEINPVENYLVLSTDATDTADPIKGIPDIPSDGVSSCLIKIQKKSGSSDNSLTGAAHTDTVNLETTRGRLSTLRVSLVKGAAEVILTSNAETCTAIVTATAEGLKAENIQIQFAP